MNIFPSIVDTVGNTPLVRMNFIPEGTGVEILLKCEFMNPLFSVKDRIAKAMIHEAEMTGKLKPGGTIVEATSGNAGIALAFVSKAMGYHCILVMPDSMSKERRALLHMLGAELCLTPGALAMNGAINKARQIAAEDDDAFMPDQFFNPVNVEAHYETTGVEILEQTDGQIDAFVAAAGTGGTFGGVARRLKENIPGIKCIVVEPAESAVLSGGRPGFHQIQGIGPGFIPPILDLSLADEIMTVASADCIDMARRVNQEEAIPCGISTGANVAAAMRLAERPEYKGKRIVTVASSAVERYMSTPFVRDMMLDQEDQ